MLLCQVHEHLNPLATLHISLHVHSNALRHTLPTTYQNHPELTVCGMTDGSFPWLKISPQLLNPVTSKQLCLTFWSPKFCGLQGQEIQKFYTNTYRCHNSLTHKLCGFHFDSTCSLKPSASRALFSHLQPLLFSQVPVSF